MESSIDVIVIGGGPAGENAAGRVVAQGLSAIVVESELLGGECSYWACMPSKALIRPGTARRAAQAVAGAAEAVTGRLDVGAVLARRDRFAANWDDAGQVEWAEGAGIRVVRGKARLTGERTVVVEDEAGAATWTARHAVVIASGSVPVVPPIDGLDSTRYWGTREATSAREVPARLAVIGGGVAGTELAQAFGRLGSHVTLLARSTLLSGLPEPAVALVAEALEAEGVDVRTFTSPRRVRRGGDRDVVRIELDDGGIIEAEELLVSTGRRPAVTELGLDSVGFDASTGLSVGADGVVDGVDGQWLYAVSDAAGNAPLTHQGKYEARIVADVIVARAAGHDPEPAGWSRFAATASQRAVPQVVFTDPEIAQIGLTPDQAAERGIRTREVTHDMAVAGAALHADRYRGWAGLVVDEDARVIVGATFAGPDVSEMLHAATIAVVGEVPLERLWHAVPAYPTISEVWLRLLEEYGL
ncbi:dihydrolipoyl dehydrogenase family protein [Spelaeicoccus albus]|uniref:Dihydrolipoamide dehydrogenase n=1 Tax=Spelaeicoccus albus TaxID=1280376 RepID=A0A7Z0D414_9MICO|nr:NAD(P)/FAD-dependent oxidoreductase [Spelaeicoccus albus]NYI68453.1 dihydrolipoamide dehydrogenase [Spelaeicoccus albus]